MLNVVILGKGEWVQSDAVNRKLFFFSLFFSFLKDWEEGG